MKIHPLLIAITFFSLPICLAAQERDSGEYLLTQNAKLTDFGMISSDRVHVGYLFQLDSTYIEILKRYEKTNETTTYSKFQLQVNQLKYVKIYKAERNHGKGALLGAGIGAVGGVLFASFLKGPKCEEGTWHPGQLADCLASGAVFITKLFIVTGCTLTGTITGAAIGLKTSITIPIKGKRENYEAAKPKLLEYTILRN